MAGLMELRIAPLQPEHRAGWLELAQGYKAFYATPTSDAEYEAAWQRLLLGQEARGVVALQPGPGAAQVVGLAHYLFHTSTWAHRVCYLQDLYTAPAARGQGVARALIAAVAQAAQAGGASRYYWLTQETNATARRLYDQVAQFRGFIRYDHPLPVAAAAAH